MSDKIKNEIVVVGTVYPGIEKYINDYVSSMNDQSTNEFDLLIANDGLKKFKIALESKKHFCKTIDVCGTVSSNRRNIINCAIEMGYKKIVFTDCDDVFEINRIEHVNELLEHNAVVVNDLDLINENGIQQVPRYFSARFNEASKINEDMIRSGNIMGLSNTAVCSETLKNIPALGEGDSIAFDWYLWACVFHLENDAYFTGKTSTKYRIYGNNTAGLPQLLNENNISKGIKVKQQHYKLMRKFDPLYVDLHNQFKELSSKWKNKTWRVNYIDALKDNCIVNHMWWENIRPASEIGLV